MTNLLKKATVGLMVLTMIGATAGTAFAQALVLYRVSQVRANMTDIWRVQVGTPGTAFRVEVEGDGDTDLDLFVYDAVTGQLLGVDDDELDFCIVSGYSRSGRIRIEIKNLGQVYNEYELTVERR